MSVRVYTVEGHNIIIDSTQNLAFYRGGELQFSDDAMDPGIVGRACQQMGIAMAKVEVGYNPHNLLA